MLSGTSDSLKLLIRKLQKRTAEETNNKPPKTSLNPTQQIQPELRLAPIPSDSALLKYD